MLFRRSRDGQELQPMKYEADSDYILNVEAFNDLHFGAFYVHPSGFAEREAYIPVFAREDDSSTGVFFHPDSNSLQVHVYVPKGEPKYDQGSEMMVQPYSRKKMWISVDSIEEGKQKIADSERIERFLDIPADNA